MEDIFWLPDFVKAERYALLLMVELLHRFLWPRESERRGVGIDDAYRGVPHLHLEVLRVLELCAYHFIEPFFPDPHIEAQVREPEKIPGSTVGLHNILRERISSLPPNIGTFAKGVQAHSDERERIGQLRPAHIF